MMTNSIDFHIRQHVKDNPSKTAVTFQDQSVSYAQLLEGYTAMAARLSRYRLHPGDVVAILCERNVELLYAILAVLRLDCTYLPIDKLNPRQRVEYILSNSGANLIITDDVLDLGEEWPQVQLDSLTEGGYSLDDIGEAKEGENEGFCIMYTSGTTGKPKGTLLHKAGVFNHLQAKIDCCAMDGNTVMAQNAGYYFVNSMWQIFAPLVLGASMAIYDRHIMKDMDRLAQKMRQDCVSVFQAVPSFWNRFFDYAREKDCQFASLRCLVSTSEKLNHSLVVKCFKVFPAITLVNAYGQTECCDDVLHHVMTAPPEEYDIPIGRPVRNMRIYVIDDDNRVCPPGGRGEICAAGVGLSRGYLNAPEVTARAFAKGSDFGLEEDYLYRTGDIGYQREDGVFVYLGRKDYQVKIHGFRVELYEIESVLLQYPDIVQAAVISLEEREGGKLIAFYCVKRDIDPGHLTAFLKSQLPSYMVPREFICLEQFPLTAMEKIDRKQLKERMASIR